MVVREVLRDGHRRSRSHTAKIAARERQSTRQREADEQQLRCKWRKERNAPDAGSERRVRLAVVGPMADAAAMSATVRICPLMASDSDSAAIAHK